MRWVPGVLAVFVLAAACGQSDSRAYPDNDGPGSLEEALSQFAVAKPPCDVPDIRYAVLSGAPSGSSLYVRFSAEKSCVDGFVGALSAPRTPLKQKGANLPFYPSTVEKFGWKFDAAKDYQTYTAAPSSTVVLKIAVDTTTAVQVVYLYGLGR